MVTTIILHLSMMLVWLKLNVFGSRYGKLRIMNEIRNKFNTKFKKMLH